MVHETTYDWMMVPSFVLHDDGGDDGGNAFEFMHSFRRLQHNAQRSVSAAQFSQPRADPIYFIRIQVV